MFVVPTTPYEEHEWENVFEVSSLENWVEERNNKMTEMGINHRYWAISERKAEYCDGSGKLIKSYLACEKNPFRLI
jgi:hypothetical protein